MLSLKIIIMVICAVKRSRHTGVATSSVNNKLITVKRRENLSKIYLWSSSIFYTVLCEGFLAFLKLQFNQLHLKGSSFIYTFSVVQNLILYLHCSSNKLVEKTNHETLNVIKNTLSIKLGNPKSLKE